MVSLKEACDKILKAHPGQYIHVVNEFKDAYYFVLLNDGEVVGPTTFVFWMPSVIKETGELIEDSCGLEEMAQGDYKQYTASDLERL